MGLVSVANFPVFDNCWRGEFKVYSVKGVPALSDWWVLL